MNASVAINNLNFSYVQGTNLFSNHNLNLKQGESLYIAGPSGSGKSTLLNLIVGLIDSPKKSISILGHDLNQLTHYQKDKFRGDHFGIIFQVFNLINFLTVEENIFLPLSFSDLKKERHKKNPEAIHSIIAQLGLNHLLQRKAAELSLGEQQRVAVARALLGFPEIIIADEPTSALDEANKHNFIEILLKLCHEYQMTLLFVSHDTSLRNHFNQHLELKK